MSYLSANYPPLHITNGPPQSSLFFFFNDTATTEIYTLSLHDALPIYLRSAARRVDDHGALRYVDDALEIHPDSLLHRSEEHTSELQSRLHLVCRLLLEKKKIERQPREPEPRSSPILTSGQDE